MLNRLLPLITATLVSFPAFAQVVALQESDFWQAEVSSGEMPAIAERLPRDPLIVDLEAKGRTFGKQGGTLRTMVTRSKDVRQMVVYGYARLVGYDHNYELQPDLVKDFSVEEGRIFTFHLREGHRWSTGAPFTSADFKYWWESVANHPELSPNGPSDIMRRMKASPQCAFPTI